MTRFGFEYKGMTNQCAVGASRMSPRLKDRGDLACSWSMAFWTTLRTKHVPNMAYNMRGILHPVKDISPLLEHELKFSHVCTKIMSTYI